MTTSLCTSSIRYPHPLRHQVHYFIFDYIKSYLSSSPQSTTTTPEFNINPELSKEDERQVRERLTTLTHTFAATKQIPHISPNVQHHIYLIDPQPVKQAPYRQSPAKAEAVTKEVRRLLEVGLIIPSNSPWSSPVSLVPKPDGSWRMVIDYRKVNAKSRKDAYPVPLIEDCLNACKNADFMSIIDIKDAYHHIQMALESQGITAFVTADGLFEWTRMPFGLANAPATFQRYVDECLREFIGKYCAVFFDDCMVYTTGSLKQHLDEVEAVLLKLCSVGLEASPSKCKFAYRELRFVGHIVGRGTIKPDPEKLRAVKEFPLPTNLTQLKGFLGLANYYRKFINGFAKIARPMYTMTTKGADFVWSQARIMAFEELKTALISAPCLYAPDFKIPFVLQTDASGIGISGILSQYVRTEEHPVGYVSRQLNSAEQNYSPTEWECLAVVWSIAQFEVFLIDAPFTIVTDHSALQWLATKKMENKRLTRWALTLQEYSYTIQHRAGTANANADALSRSPLEGSAPPVSPAGDEVSALVHGTQAHFIRRMKLRHHTEIPFPICLKAQRTKIRRIVRNPKGVMERIEVTHEPVYDDILSVDLAQLTAVTNEQRRDPSLRELITYLERKELPAHMDSAEQLRFIRRSDDYAMIPTEINFISPLLFPS